MWALVSTTRERASVFFGQVFNRVFYKLHIVIGGILGT
jgi:hypothetical protein